MHFKSLSSVTSSKESSQVLLKHLCDSYNTKSEVLNLNKNASMCFCAKEIARVIGMEDTGMSFEDYDDQCKTSV